MVVEPLTFEFGMQSPGRLVHSNSPTTVFFISSEGSIPQPSQNQGSMGHPGSQNLTATAESDSDCGAFFPSSGRTLGQRGLARCLPCSDRDGRLARLRSLAAIPL